MNIMTTPHAATRQSSRGRLPDGTANPIDTHVGQRIKLRRTLLGMSQDQLGALLGLSFQQVQKYERGGNRVSASRLYDMARVLDVPVGYFFDAMDADVQAASPAAVASGAVTTAPDSVSADNLLIRRDVLELVRDYAKLTDDQAAAVRRLVASMAGEG